MVDVADFKAGMRLHVSGVSLITTLDQGLPYGLIATSVSALTIDPPTLVLCIGQASQSLPHILRSGIFCVNLMSYSDEKLAKQFSSSDRESRFSSGEWIAHASGSPALKGALASFDCFVSDAIEHRSHVIVIGEVNSIRFGDQGGHPLLYRNGYYTTSLS